MLATVKHQVCRQCACVYAPDVCCVCVCVQVNTKNLLKLCMEGQSVCIHVCGMDAHYTQIKLNVVHTLTVSAVTH